MVENSHRLIISHKSVGWESGRAKLGGSSVPHGTDGITTILYSWQMVLSGGSKMPSLTFLVV